MIDNEEALAYGWMMLLLYFGGSICIWFAWGLLIDYTLVTTINPFIVAGGMSQQAVTAGEWNINVAKFAPPLILILGYIFAVNRAIYAKGRIM